MSEAAERIGQRIAELAAVTDVDGEITRTYGSPAMQRANNLVADWLRDAGLAVRTDAIGNLMGRSEGSDPNGKTFMLGSHLDTVRNAGAFDGPLGVILAIECVKHLHTARTRLPFAVEVIGFCDEEGVRFQMPYLGSRALTCSIAEADLKRQDERGCSLREAIRAFGGQPEHLSEAQRDPTRLLAYGEVHIEQGPVLEQSDLGVGVVTAIAGQSRIKVRFNGKAGHAGTTPMNLRRDALTAAAEFICQVEARARSSLGLVATVGQIEVAPGASNVIPGEARLTLDVRHLLDSERTIACQDLRRSTEHLAGERKLEVTWEVVHETPSVPCDPHLTSLLSKSAQEFEPGVIALTSGAGHDAAIMADITPSVMLFVRCREGISHHPDELVKTEDIALAVEIMNSFIQLLAAKHA